MTSGSVGRKSLNPTERLYPKRIPPPQGCYLGSKEFCLRNQFAVFYLKDNVLIGVDAVNSPREFMVCKQLYGKVLDPEKLRDPATDLKTLLG